MGKMYVNKKVQNRVFEIYFDGDHRDFLMGPAETNIYSLEIYQST